MHMYSSDNLAPDGQSRCSSESHSQCYRTIIYDGGHYTILLRLSNCCSCSAGIAFFPCRFRQFL